MNDMTHRALAYREIIMPFLLQHRYAGFSPVLALLVALPANAAADSDFQVFGGYAVQEKSLQFALNTIPIDSTQKTGNFSLGAASRGFYVLLEFERPFSQDISIRQPSTSPVQISIEREDSTLTVGYNLWRSLNIFVGRKSGYTNVESEVISTTNSVVAVGYRYSEKGNFAGASYSFDFGARGQLGLSLAYANLPTEVSGLWYGSPAAAAVFTSGITRGTSYGIKWTGPLAPQLDYSIGYKLSKYEFTDTALTADNGGGLGLSTKQDYKTFSIGISKIF
jgi:hypothetical protein